MEKLKFDAPSGDIDGYLFRKDKGHEKLAVILPGAGYSFRQPILHYALQVILAKGYQVLALDKLYANEPKWQNALSEEAAAEIVETDAVEVFRQIPGAVGLGPELILAR